MTSWCQSNLEGLGHFLCIQAGGGWGCKPRQSRPDLQPLKISMMRDAPNVSLFFMHCATKIDYWSELSLIVVYFVGR